MEEEEAQERSKPEHPKQLHLLRTKYQVLSNLWLLAKLRQPGRALHRDLDERTCPLLLEELLNRKNFAFQRQLENSEVMVGPDFGAALLATYNCPQHRMEHWIMFLTVANTRSEKDKQTKNTALENKDNALEKQLANIRNNRSRSPRKQLALTEKTLGREVEFTWWQKSRSRKKLRKRSAQRHQQEQQTSPASSKGSKTFVTIQKKHGLTLFHEKARSSPGICFRFQKHACFDSVKCGREHICIGCGKAGVPYNDCFCLESSA